MMKKTQKTLFFLVIAILFLVSFYVLLQSNLASSQNQAEQISTSEWLTYRNEEYGFEFKYPSNLEIYESGGEISVRANLPWPEKGTSLTFREEEKTLQQYIDAYNISDVLSNGLALSKIIKQEDYSIDGVQADLLTGTTAIGIDRNMIFVTYNDRNYVISFNHNATDEELITLKTFKFIN